MRREKPQDGNRKSGVALAPKGIETPEWVYRYAAEVVYGGIIQSTTKWAQKYGVDRHTLERWKMKPAVRAMISEHREEFRAEMRERLFAGAATALSENMAVDPRVKRRGRTEYSPELLDRRFAAAAKVLDATMPAPERGAGIQIQNIVSASSSKTDEEIRRELIELDAIDMNEKLAPIDEGGNGKRKTGEEEKK